MTSLADDLLKSASLVSASRVSAKVNGESREKYNERMRRYMKHWMREYRARKRNAG